MRKSFTTSFALAMALVMVFAMGGTSFAAKNLVHIDLSVNKRSVSNLFGKKLQGQVTITVANTGNYPLHFQLKKSWMRGAYSAFMIPPHTAYTYPMTLTKSHYKAKLDCHSVLLSKTGCQGYVTINK